MHHYVRVRRTTNLEQVPLGPSAGSQAVFVVGSPCGVSNPCGRHNQAPTPPGRPLAVPFTALWLRMLVGLSSTSRAVDSRRKMTDQTDYLRPRRGALPLGSSLSRAPCRECVLFPLYMWGFSFARGKSGWPMVLESLGARLFP
jgi:hypothetical protein